MSKQMRARSVFFSCSRDLPSPDLPVTVASSAISGETLLHLSVPKIVANWRAENWYARHARWTDDYLGTDAAFWVEPERMHSLVKMIQDGRELPPVIVAMGRGAVPGPCYPDGRHRIVLFSAMGITSIPARVEEDDADAIAAALGSEDVDPRLTIADKRRSPRP